MKTTCFFTLLLLLLTLCPAHQARAVGGSTLLDADLRGTVSWEASGDGSGGFLQEWRHGNYSSTASYFSGQYSSGSGSDFFSFVDQNFFRFDLSTLGNATWVTEATLQLEHSGTSSSLTYNVVGINEGPYTSDPLTSDPRDFFQSFYGSAYGSAPISGASSGDVLDVVLNTVALIDINAAHLAGNSIFFGGTVSSSSNVGIFAQTGTSSFLTQLDLETAPNVSPVADVASLTIPLGEGATLDGSGSTDSDSIYGDVIGSYAWDLDGDGTFDFDSPSATLALTTTELANFGIGAAGSYDITLRVEDSWGASGTVVQNLTVTAIPEPTSFLLAALAGLAGLGSTSRRRRQC